MANPSPYNGLTTVPSAQITQTPCYLILIENYDVKSSGRFMWALLSDILDNPISVVNMLYGNNFLSKGPLPFVTFYAVQSTKMDENQFSFFSESEIVQGFCI